MGRAHSRRLNLIALAVLLVALAAGTGLRIHAQHANPNVQHDEAWSYASAAGRLGPFLAAMDGGLTGRWVPASEWRTFWQSEGLGDVANIAPDLAANDVHPPLYFGLLHGWLLLTGEHVWAGRALNLVFAVLAILGIFGFARSLGFERIEGALAALVWAVSPAVVSISSIARQYDLVALTTVLLAWGLVRASAPEPDDVRRERQPRAPRAGSPSLWVAAATAAALLTHYQAVLLVAAGVVYVVAGAYLGGRYGAAPVLVADARRPGRRRARGRAARARLVRRVRARALAPGGLLRRRVLREAGGDRPDRGPLRRRPRPGASAWRPRWSSCSSSSRGTRRALTRRIRRARPGWWTILFFVLVTAGAICLQNLLFLSMPPRISARYLAMAWPFLAFLPLLFFGIWPRLRYALTAAFCLLILVPATIATPLLYGGEDRLPLQQLAGASAVLVDNVGVGGAAPLPLVRPGRHAGVRRRPRSSSSPTRTPGARPSSATRPTT